MCPPISQRASRLALFAVLVPGLFTACDPTASLDPEKTKGIPVAQASYTVTASNLSATVVSWSQINVSWASNPSANGYQIFRSVTGPTGTYDLIATVGAAARSYANTGLSGSTNYCYQIRSFKNAGKNTNYSAFAGPVCATTLAPPVVAPSETEAIPQATSILVKWKDNSADETGFRIEQSADPAGPWTQVRTAVANATSIYIYALTEQRTCARVIAYNDIGPSLPSLADCTVIPAAPTNLEAKTLDGQSFTLTWKDNSAAEDGYQVRRRDPSGSLILLGTLSTNTESYRDATVQSNAVYKYQVQAIKDGGYSDVSNEAQAVIATTLPAAPENAFAAFAGDYDGYGWLYFGVSWTDMSTNELGFRIEYSADGVSNWSTYTTTAADSTYIQERSDIFYGYPAPSGCYRVVAFNNVGDSPPSNNACAEHGAGPTELVATPADEQSISLTWKDNATYDVAYVVLRSTVSDYDYSIVAYLPANSTSYSDNGLTTGQEYWYYVAAVYSGDYWSDYSNIASAIPGSTTAGIRGSADVKTNRRRPALAPGVKRVPRHVPALPSINPRR